MGRKSPRHAVPNPSDRSESLPPAYSSRPPSLRPRLNEQTPLLSNVVKSTPSETQHTPDPPLYLQIIPLLILAVAAFFLYKFFFGGSASLPPVPDSPIYSVAIIGAGPAGISAAQHLHLKSIEKGIHLNITLFESGPLLGGQLALNASTGDPVFPYDDPAQNPISAEDIAGTALVWSNPLFTKTYEATLGDNVDFSERPSQQVSYFSDGHVVSETTRPYSKTPTTNWLGLIWKYGSSIWRAGAMAKDGKDLRDRFVDAPLTSDVTQLLISLGFYDFVEELAQTGLEHRGISDPYVTEVLSPQVEKAYAQRLPSLSTLAMILAVSKEDHANSYVGGELIDRLEQIVSAIGVNVRMATEVASIKHSQLNKWESAWLVGYGAFGLSNVQAEAFDRVIIAAPNFDLYQASSINDVEAASVLTYQPAHVTFFTVPSRLNPDVFGNADQILFLEQQGEDDRFAGLRELAYVRELVRVGDDGDKMLEHLYRVLSHGDATAQLEKLELGITWLYQTRIENAYPDLFPFRRFPPFKLSDKGLWWTSAIHAVASTVDMSCLAGKIVAEEVIKDLEKEE
ncbi:hypothetical protein F4804DRAFT_328813 [Jackrogersella minutella]|nr:hypothetical protein F4804DRAFT_328813 [Jackrogersella minutella]